MQEADRLWEMHSKELVVYLQVIGFVFSVFGELEHIRL
jgi:hypothetical protein